MAVSRLNRTISRSDVKRLERRGATVDANRSTITVATAKASRSSARIGKRHKKLLVQRGHLVLT